MRTYTTYSLVAVLGISGGSFALAQQPPTKKGPFDVLVAVSEIRCALRADVQDALKLNQLQRQQVTMLVRTQGRGAGGQGGSGGQAGGGFGGAGGAGGQGGQAGSGGQGSGGFGGAGGAGGQAGSGGQGGFGGAGGQDGQGGQGGGGGFGGAGGAAGQGGAGGQGGGGGFGGAGGAGGQAGAGGQGGGGGFGGAGGAGGQGGQAGSGGFGGVGGAGASSGATGWWSAPTAFRIQTSVASVLTPSQRRRLHEISLQFVGNAALLDPGIDLALGVTAVQQKQMNDLVETANASYQALLAQLRSRQIDFETARSRDAIAKNKLEADLGAVLTSTQSDLWRKYQSKPIRPTG